MTLRRDCPGIFGKKSQMTRRLENSHNVDQLEVIALLHNIALVPKEQQSTVIKKMGFIPPIHHNAPVLQRHYNKARNSNAQRRLVVLFPMR